MQFDGLCERPAALQPSSDRVRQNTPPEINNRIDEAMMKRIWEYATKSKEEITARIEELDREWDLERVLETGAGALALSGVVLRSSFG